MLVKPWMLLAAAAVGLLGYQHADLVRTVIGVGCFALVGLALLIAAISFSPLSLGFTEIDTGSKPRRGILNERFSKKKVEEAFDVVVIGSGMGGLSCAASLSRFGKKVLVLEQHDVAGGGTHMFVVDGKKDYEFDSGLHYTIPESGELLQLACGTRHKPVEFEKLGDDDGCFDKVVLGDPSDPGFRVKHGQKHLDDLRGMFPDPKDQREMDEFVDLSNRINDLIPFWILSKLFPKSIRKLWKAVFLNGFTKYASRNGEQVTRSIVSNNKLAALLCGLWMDAGTPPYEASFVMTAALSVGFPKQGGAYPVGGSERMATCLIQAIEAAGGKVLVKARVREIEVEKPAMKTKGVTLEDGTFVPAPIVVAACGYTNLYTKLLPDWTVPVKYAPRDSSGSRTLPPQLREAMGWVMANVGVRANPKDVGVTSCNSWFQNCSEENDWDFFEGTREYFKDPLGSKLMPMMLTFPSLKDRACVDGEKGVVTCQLLVLSAHDWFEKWWADNGKHEPNGEYEVLKKKFEDKMLDALVAHYPKLKGKIDFVDLSTPLSIRYYLNKRGAIGLDVTPGRFSDEATEDLLDMKTPIDGVWLTGEDPLLCGQPLAQLSGILTAWRIAGLAGSLSFLFGIFRLALSDLLGL